MDQFYCDRYVNRYLRKNQTKPCFTVIGRAVFELATDDL